MRRHLVIVIGILAAGYFSTCAAVNLQEAKNRSRQKRTMAGLREWANAIETIMVRSDHLKSTPLIEGTSVDLATVAAKHKLPLRDGWDHPFRISASKGSYLVQAAGSDGIFETITTTGIVDTYDRDLAYSDGSFIRQPEGI